MIPHPGTRLQVTMSKWGDRPHWEFAATYLGEDEHGHWAAVPRGTSFRRPGAGFESSWHQVTLIPPTRWWVASFTEPGGAVEIYVDMTTPATLDEVHVRCVDLDLDVIRLADGQVLVDDEDEFAAHQVTLGYPAEVVRQAEQSCADVLAAVSARTPPFDGAAAGVWLERLAQLTS